ncbi:MAG: cytochrome c3 family protein [Bacteroidetes bacterium]|nr:cytochrome c3 family protein [Bacteroidota bacterium]MBL6944941.1 cytochrome c3 family protein [Bacteroidales bacterium]
MKKLLFINLIVLFSTFLIAQEITDESVEHSPENSKCFYCHGNPTYSFYNEILERNVTNRMNPYLIIDSALYYYQNHSSFECIDCHSYGFKTFPHDNELQMEAMPGCFDCHEGDDEVYNFAKIDQQFQESVHSTKHSQDFTCWMCHNPHTYKINARNNQNLLETIVYDNNICLSCHADINKYQLISSDKNPNIIEKHDWLPNQISHFAHVRCIECHTDTSNNILVAHKVQTKDKAVRKCVECHSQNSILMSSLYKFQAIEKRNKYGFFNASTLDDSYIIGANRNYYLNVLSGLIFGFVLLLIFIHAVLRIFIK